jgi:hypothetical protein
MRRTGGPKGKLKTLFASVMEQVKQMQMSLIMSAARLDVISSRFLG